MSQLILSERKDGATRKKRTIVAFSHPDSILSEQFRMIQTNINFLISDQKSPILIISSPIDGEGKSTVIANLAVSIAQQKKKVLLIDANLRRPSLHSFFNNANTEGLTDILIGRKSIYEVIHHTEVWKLDLLPSGYLPNNPVEILGSPVMTELLRKARDSYDYILIDSAALNDIPDTKLLANLSDGVILVVQNNKTKTKEALEAKKVIEFARAKLVGVILNQ